MNAGNIKCSGELVSEKRDASGINGYVSVGQGYSQDSGANAI